MDKKTMVSFGAKLIIDYSERVFSCDKCNEPLWYMAPLYCWIEIVEEGALFRVILCEKCYKKLLKEKGPTKEDIRLIFNSCRYSHLKKLLFAMKNVSEMGLF